MNHQATPGLLSLSQIRHIIHRFLRRGGGGGGGGERLLSSLDVSNLINNILFSADVRIISSPRQQMLVLCFFFGGFDQTQKKGPFSVPFFSLSVTLICISPHIGKASPAEQKAAFGSWMSLNIAQYPGDIRGNPPLFSRLAQVQPAVKSLSFLYSL